jgi:transposase-like protein
VTNGAKLSGRHFRADEVRLQLGVLAYNLGNLWRRPGLPSRLKTPRDRNGKFEPRIVAKGSGGWKGFDQKIMSLYARGVTTREIVAHLEEIHGIEVSPMLTPNVTDEVLG